MVELELTQSVPLARNDNGIIRVAGSRVTLDSLLHQFKCGATAEQIHEDFPSVTLSDVYSVIAYYLQHSCAVEDYLKEQALASEEVRREVENAIDSRQLRARLQRRIQAAV